MRKTVKILKFDLSLALTLTNTRDKIAQLDFVNYKTFCKESTCMYCSINIYSNSRPFTLMDSSV